MAQDDLTPYDQMTPPERVRALYGLIAKRSAADPFTPNQAASYRDMVAVLDDCNTLEDMAAAVQGTALYLGPGAALMKDKARAAAMAADEDAMPEVSIVYRDKIARLDHNMAELYDSRYQRTASNLQAQYRETREAFARIYEGYLALRCADPANPAALKDAQATISEALAELVKPSHDVFTLAALPQFRALIPATDDAYRTFVADLHALLGPDGAQLGADTAELARADEAAAQAFAELSALHDAGSLSPVHYTAVSALPRVDAYAPESASGSYTYR